MVAPLSRGVGADYPMLEKNSQSIQRLSCVVLRLHIRLG